MELGNIPTTGLTVPAETRASQDREEVAKSFEAMFLTEAVDQMLRQVDIGSFGGGHAEETWRGFLARAVADQIADQGGTGIAGTVDTAIAAYENAVFSGDKSE
ncbi:hypothetical protein LCGC14_2944530 [marine sediment metagenome]|uniref:Flagellar protein FlgJ N-terminal domain-containing protein n=1 Tax=marine sediment metagenome TaxID=412755 RepID=A0A0F8Y464_9ZZZZ